jgi:hypothetical protein
MRLGCSGCLVVVMFLGALAAVGWTVVRMLDSPATVPGSTSSAADSASAQKKLYGALRRGPDAGPVTLTEREVNAIVTRNLDTAIPLGGLSLRLVHRDTVEIVGRVPLGRVIAEVRGEREPTGSAWGGRPVWLTVRGTPRLEGDRPGPGAARRYVTLDVEAAWVGRVRLPVALLRLILAPETRARLRWRAPVALQELRVEPGLVVIRVASRDAS